jgi:hypothetical protein
MAQTYSELITIFYNPDTQTIWSRGRFVSVQEFVKNLPKQQDDVIPPKQDSSTRDPEDVEALGGPVIKCINGKEYICYQAVCYGTGRSC